MTEEEARADLEAKVRELLNDCVEDGMKRLATLIASGSGVVQDHMKADGLWATPKTFMMAYAKQVEWNYGRPYATPAQNRTLDRIVQNYYTLM